MKIIKLGISGFRSLKRVEWEPGDLNVLIGPNGSGKSNLLRLLELVSAAATGRLAGLIKGAGGMGAVCWDNEKNGYVSFRLKTSPVKPGGNLASESLTYAVELARLGDGASYLVETEELANYSSVEQQRASTPFKFLDRRRSAAHLFDESPTDDGRKVKGLVRLPDDVLAHDETALSVAGNPIVGTFLKNRVLTAYQRNLSDWSVYHAFGAQPESSVRQPSVARHETRVAADGANLISVLHTLYASRVDFRERIDDAMRAAFPDSYKQLSFPPVADQTVQLAIQFSGLKHATAAAALSDGTLRFLFLLTVLGSPEPAPVIAVDEPEIGLHPGMLSLVAEFAVEASRRAQIIISTHSEALLNAFNETRPATTIFKWDQGETTLAQLPDGQLAEWLKAYSLGSLFASGELESVP